MREMKDDTKSRVAKCRTFAVYISKREYRKSILGYNGCDVVTNLKGKIKYYSCVLDVVAALQSVL